MNWRTSNDSSVPEWFWKAIDTESREDEIAVMDCKVHYRCWGSPDKPGILLAHGMFAHSRWWDFIAPLLMDDYYLVGLDFTGMGDSDYRYDYTAALFAKEISAVIEASGMNKAILVGHSFGGYIGVKAAVRYPDQIKQLILVDSAIRSLEELKKQSWGNLSGGSSVFPDAETAWRRFRLQPPQPCENEYIVEYIGRRSVMKVDNGWTWKFDEDMRPSLQANDSGEDHAQTFKAIDCPLGLIVGEKSALFEKYTIPFMQSLRRKPFPVHIMTGAHHHCFLDQPLQFVKALKEMLKELEGSSF